MQVLKVRISDPTGHGDSNYGHFKFYSEGLYLFLDLWLQFSPSNFGFLC